MNQLIKHLAEQASAHELSYAYYRDGVKKPENAVTYHAVDLEKFAELIVQECVNVLHDNELWNRHISHALKEHFGVEE